jgi:hypothetical protein
VRVSQRHVVDKLRKTKARGDATASRLIAGSKVYWLLHMYLDARGERFFGVEQAIETLRARDPAFVQDVLSLLDPTARLSEALESASERALSPVGDVCPVGELVARGWSGDASNEELDAARGLIEPLVELAAACQPFIPTPASPERAAI